MKPYLYSLIAAAAALGMAQAQTTAVTTPVGYVTENLQTGFNLLGVSVHQPVIDTGTFTAVGATTVTDSAATFTTTLPAGTYILEIKSGVQSGAIQVFSSYTNTQITTEDDLSVAGVIVGDSYVIRGAATINSVFGANNSANLQASDSSANADIIWVPTGPGTYAQYYRNQGLVLPGPVVIVPPSWQTLGGAEAGNTPLPYTDGMFIERKGGPLALVITGEVKVKSSTRIPIPNGFTIVSSGFPVGSTLDNSGLQNFLTASDSSTNADIVWMPTGPGTYNQYYYNQGLVLPGPVVIIPPSWQTLGGAPAGTTELKSGMFIERKGANTSAVISIPYPSL